MKIPTSLDETYAMVKLLWKSVETSFPYWHGWAFRKGRNGMELVFYVVPGADSGPLVQASAGLSQILPVKIVALNRFRRAGGDNGAGLAKTSVRPGTGVHSKSSKPDCSEPCPGTVSAFFRTRGTEKPVWLLSNHHVLVNNEACLPVQIFTESGVLISKSVLPVPLTVRGNRVDAALAELLDPTIADAVYDPIELTSTTPDGVADGDIVQKFGVATGLTCGKVRHAKIPMMILDCDENNNREFVDQIMIDSIPGRPDFLDKRDSGSLVVRNKQPVAVLFALTNSDAAGPATGLATPWQTVLDEISKIIPGPLEMMLTAGSKFENPCLGLAAHQ